MKAPSVFDWKGRESIFMADKLFASRNQGGAGMPAKEQPLRHRTGSIAGLEPLKQKPGVGTSRTS